MKKVKKDIARCSSKKKIIGIISVCFLLIVGIASVLLLNKKDTNLDGQDEHIAMVIPKESPCTLDEIYEKIESNWLFDKYARLNYEDEAIELAYVLFHFYDYFNEETELLVWDTIDSVTWEPLTFKKISFEEYTERINIYLPILEESLSHGVSNYFYVIDFRHFLLHDVKFV